MQKDSSLNTSVSTRSNTILAPDHIYLLNGQTPTPGDQIAETESLAIVVEGNNDVMVFENEELLYEWAVAHDKAELVDQIQRARHYRQVGEALGFPEELSTDQLKQLNFGVQDRAPGMYLFANVSQGGGGWPSGPTWSYGSKRNTASSFAGVGGTALYDNRWFTGISIYLFGLSFGDLNWPIYNFDDRAESGI